MNIKEILKRIKHVDLKKEIIVVDDGSTDGTRDILKKIEDPEIKIVFNEENKGKGSALQTGFKHVSGDIVIIQDADLEYYPDEYKVLIEKIVEGKADVVLGSRLKNPKGMPWYKIIQNNIGNVITWYLYGLWVTDSQSGFRAYSFDAAEKINTKADKYEYDSEVIREIYIYKLKYMEVPIKVRYTEYSMGKKTKQSLWNGIKTVYRMIWSLIS